MADRDGRFEEAIKEYYYPHVLVDRDVHAVKSDARLLDVCPSIISAVTFEKTLDVLIFSYLWRLVYRLYERPMKLSMIAVGYHKRRSRTAIYENQA